MYFETFIVILNILFASTDYDCSRMKEDCGSKRNLVCSGSYMSKENPGALLGNIDNTYKPSINFTAIILNEMNQWKNTFSSNIYEYKNLAGQIFSEPIIVPPLNWSEDLAKRAAILADTCIFMREECSVYAAKEKFGGNIGHIQAKDGEEESIRSILKTWFYQYINTPDTITQMVTSQAIFNKETRPYSPDLIEDLKLINISVNYEILDFIHMIHDGTTQVGCAMRSCKPSDKPSIYFLVCYFDRDPMGMPLFSTERQLVCSEYDPKYCFLCLKTGKYEGYIDWIDCLNNTKKLEKIPFLDTITDENLSYLKEIPETQNDICPYLRFSCRGLHQYCIENSIVANFSRIMTKEIRDLIIEKHNYYRNLIACNNINLTNIKGEVFPVACYMQEVVWSAGLAWSSALHQCYIPDDFCIDTPKYEHVGVMYETWYVTQNMSTSKLYEKVNQTLYQWFGQYYNLAYYSIYSYKNRGINIPLTPHMLQELQRVGIKPTFEVVNAAQMLKDNNDVVGCSITKCETEKMLFYTFACSYSKSVQGVLPYEVEAVKGNPYIYWFGWNTSSMCLQTSPKYCCLCKHNLSEIGPNEQCVNYTDFPKPVFLVDTESGCWKQTPIVVLLFLIVYIFM